MAEKSFAIHVQHRPRRVAFLVDLKHESLKPILDAIIRFNLSSWGGRHNPIVPLIDRKIPESYYPFLDIADPDIFYVYGELDAAGLKYIHSRYAPTFVAGHLIREPIDSYSYGVRLPEHVGLSKYLRNLRENAPLFPGQPEPCVLQLDMGEGLLLSPFFLWNFGYTESNFFAIQNHAVASCRPRSIKDGDLVDLFATQNNLAWPVHVCGHAPIARTASKTDRSYYFPVFFGASPWNLVAYWNDGLTTGQTYPVRSGLNQLWLTEEIMNDDPTYKQLVRLLPRRVSGSGQQKGLKMISYEYDEPTLRRLGKKIAEDSRGALHYQGCLRLDAPAIEPVSPASVGPFIHPRGDIEYATGKEVHLTLKPPPIIQENSDQAWMVDVLIYNPEQELWYGNALPWWRLPRTASIATLFSRSRAQRIMSDRLVSFEVDAREATLDFEIPSSRKLFRHLLSPEVHYRLAADLRSEIAHSTKPHEIRLSDKGRYISGILALSDTLPGMLYLFEHPFWRSLLRKLSRPEPSKQLTAKLASDLEGLLNDRNSLNLEERESWVTQKIILASKQLAKLSVWLTFKEIQDVYEEFFKNLEGEERPHQKINLRADISELTRDGVLFQGAELRCQNCISADWYPVEELRKMIVCRGCHVPFPLPAETDWSYQLNELVRNGIADQGLSPVIRTLTRLFDRANDSFFFTPSVEFLYYPDQGEPRVERELDLAWVKDGVFGIAEVKTTTKGFKPSDYDDMAELARSLKPDVLLIAAPEGSDAEIAKGKVALQERTSKKLEVWAWGPEQFKQAPFWANY